MFKFFVLISLFLISFLSVYAEPPEQVEYPHQYRQWQHIKSMLILPGHPLENPFTGIHHIYANDLAVEGMRDGNYKNGAVFVFDLMEADNADHAFVEGERKLIGVMQKHQKRYASTGGWGFEGFAKNSQHERLSTDGGQSCFGCHTQT